MSERNNEIKKYLQEAQTQTSLLIEDVGILLMHLREAIEEADLNNEAFAKSCASDALHVLQNIEERSTNIQDKVALCTS